MVVDLASYVYCCALGSPLERGVNAPSSDPCFQNDEKEPTVVVSGSVGTKLLDNLLLCSMMAFHFVEVNCHISKPSFLIVLILLTAHS